MLVSHSRPLPAILLALVLTGCGLTAAPATSQTESTPTATRPPATPTTEPLAAGVNGQPILLREYQAELDRFETAQQERGIELALLEPYRLDVLQALIDLELLAQKAEADGATISEELLSERIDELAEQRGGSEAMAAWMAANEYDLESFRRALRRELLAQQAVEGLATTVPTELEHVHVGQILVDSRQRADELRALLEAGADFGQLAVEYSQDPSTRVNGGDLGWVPRGVLNYPAIEEVAFTLPPGQISEVIETELGYHLIEVLAREMRPPSPNDRRKLRQQAVETWLETARGSARIDILIEP
jgi:peptidyl-prolyl cis-trans isomerase C